MSALFKKLPGMNQLNSLITLFIIPVFYSLSFSSCSEEPNQQTNAKYFAKIITEQYSPNKKYRFVLGELNDSVNKTTQLMLYFDGCSSSVYNPRGWNLGIKVYWQGNDTIVVEGKNYDALVKDDFVQCYLDKVYIKYIFY